MDLTYGTTTLNLEGALAPDANVDWTKIAAGSIRRAYNGDGRRYERWTKYRLTIGWTGINSTSGQQLRAFYDAAETGTLTNIPPSVIAVTGTLYMETVPGSFSIVESGRDCYDISLQMEEV